ncbi:MAG: DUF4091 domain-containing protein [Armatimonadetes bacterium]|nr:DUF4091 domain-containing protein [Armatimonadota bacterium]
MCRFLMAMAVLLAVPYLGLCDLVWFDGSRSEGGPPGKLLSDNDGYYGDRILTGVEYTYERPPDNPPDRWRDDASKFGRRLLDGRPAGNWWTPVGITGPLVVTFDFKRTCEFSEVDIDTRNKKVAIKLQVADGADGPWQEAFSRSLEDCPDQQFHRIVLPQRPRGRYLRLTVEAPGITWLEEVLVWGDAEVTAERPEALNPTYPSRDPSSISFESIPGIERTAFPDARFWAWTADLGPMAKQPAVWSQVPTWDAITDKPLLPARAEVRDSVEIVMARNETECLALALTNTSWERAWETEISLSPFRNAAGRAEDKITGVVRVMGAIPSRWYGVNLGPMFRAGNMLPPGLMRRYLTNGSLIENFPRVTLSKAGSAVFWVSVTTSAARPGLYTARLSADGGPSLIVRARVLDVTLPAPRVWLQTYSYWTDQFPFRAADRPAKEVAYKKFLGITVWNGFPEENTPAKLAYEKKKTYYQVWGIGDYGHQLYGGRIDPDKLTDEDAAKIAELIRGHVQKARQLGLDYDEWYVELTDEPGEGNSRAFGAVCRLIRQADPRVRIYCNPSFWTGEGPDGCRPDEVIFDALSGWYKECVDVSCPLYLLLRNRPRSMTLFDAPRPVRAFYNVCTQSAKSERAAEVELYRRMAWDAFKLGWNGWGFYSYYAPRGDPWNDFDAEWYTGEDLPDYIIVYPGPYGPIPTRQSEAVREGYEDYCLLTLLRTKRLDRELNTILSEYATGKPLSELRLRALKVVAGK